MIQQINFHTSCSEPILVGDQYGAVRIESVELENGQVCESPVYTKLDNNIPTESVDIFPLDMGDLPEKGIQVKVFPIPSTNEVTIAFKPTKAENVTVEVFNMMGAKVAILFDEEVESGVTYEVKTDKMQLSYGTFIYRIISGEEIITGKLIIAE